MHLLEEGDSTNQAPIFTTVTCNLALILNEASVLVPKSKSPTITDTSIMLQINVIWIDSPLFRKLLLLINDVLAADTHH